MLGGLQNYLRRKRRAIGIAIAAVALVFAFLFFYEPSSPDGVYYERSAFSEHYHWIFKNGTLFTQVEEDLPPEIFGAYYKSGTQWIWEMGIPRTKVVIKPSWFGVKLISSQFIGGHQFWPRYGFCWAIDCWNWIHIHIFHDRQILQ